MQIYLDTANIADIQKYAAWGMVDGVTTNPTLVAREGVNPKERILEICKAVEGPVSVEVVAEDTEGMVAQARIVADWAPNIYAKIPMTSAGLAAVKQLTEEGIRTNVTLVFSVTQAVLAAKAGATLVSPFIGRIDDMGNDGMSVLEDICAAFEMYGFETKILAASIRSHQHVVDAMHLGADICTLPASILDKMVAHPLTTKGLEKFMDDWNGCEMCKNMYS